MPDVIRPSAAAPRLRIALLVSWTLLIASAGLWLADLALQPVPIPLGGATVFGAVGWWLLGRRARPATLAAPTGLLLGVAAHVRSHVVEDRVESVAHLATHATLDALLSAATAAAILLAACAPSRRARSRGDVPAATQAGT